MRKLSLLLLLLLGAGCQPTLGNLDSMWYVDNNDNLTPVADFGATITTESDTAFVVEGADGDDLINADTNGPRILTLGGFMQVVSTTGLHTVQIVTSDTEAINIKEEDGTAVFRVNTTNPSLVDVDTRMRILGVDDQTQLIIEGAPTQTVDLFTMRSDAGALYYEVTANGSHSFGRESDDDAYFRIAKSADQAFLIENTGGTDILSFNTNDDELVFHSGGEINTTNNGDLTIDTDSLGDIILYASSTEAFRVRQESGFPVVWVNLQRNDTDFRVAGDGTSNLLWVDASSDRVGIGRTPDAKLDVVGNDGESTQRLIFGEATTVNHVKWQDTNGNQVLAVGPSSTMSFGEFAPLSNGLWQFRRAGTIDDQTNLRGLFLGFNKGGTDITPTFAMAFEFGLDTASTSIQASSGGINGNMKMLNEAEANIVAAVRGNVQHEGTGTLQDYRGFWSQTPQIDAGGTIDLARAFYCEDQTSATDNYCFYAEAGKNVFNVNQDANSDFNVKGVGDADLFYIDTDNDKIGIGTSTPASKLQVAGNVIIGDGAAATDYTLTFDGETNDGVLTWMEDEDYFKFDDSVLVSDIGSASSTALGIGAANTGFYGLGNNQIRVAILGVNAFTFTDGALIFPTEGTAIAPNILSLTGNSGIYWASGDTKTTRISYLGADMLAVGDGITIGGGVAGKDYTLTFDGETSDGVITWMEDEDYFRFEDDVVFNTGAGLPYGEIYGTNVGSVVTISGTGIANKVQITAFNTNGHSNNTTPDHTNNHITATVAGKYLVNITIHADSVAGAGAKYSFDLWKNNGATRYSNIHSHVDFAGGGGETSSISLGGIIDVAANDTLEVWVYNETNTQNIEVDDITFYLTQLGG